MMKQFKNTVLTAFGMLCLLPVVGTATTFSLGGFTTTGTSINPGTGIITIDFTSLTYGSTILTATSGYFVETYHYTAGSPNSAYLTISAPTSLSGGSLVSNEQLLRINESGAGLYAPSTSTNYNNQSLYNGVTNLVFATDFASLVGLGSTTTLSPAQVTSQSIVYDYSSAAGGIFSPTTSLSIPTPEPSSLAMFGIAMFAGCGALIRKRIRAASVCS